MKIIAYVFLFILIAAGAWVDRHRQTESIPITFPGTELATRRAEIEESWKKAHPNAKKVTFTYFTSYNKVTAGLVNYYL